MEHMVLALAASPWVLLAMFALCVVDGFFPPVPSESVVIALAALAAGGVGPSPWAVVPVAALGAFVGDLVSYRIGARLPIERLPWFRSERGRSTTRTVGRALQERGVAVILAARYVPVGRVAVTMTAGATGYPWRRFVGVAALAGATWAGYSTLLGICAGSVVATNPLLAAGIGVVAGLAFGVLIDLAVRKVRSRRQAVRPDAGAPATPAIASAGPGASE